MPPPPPAAQVPSFFRNPEQDPDAQRATMSAYAAMLRTPVLVVFFSGPVPKAPRNCAPERPASVVPCTINLLENATLAEPSTLLPAKLRAVVHLAAEPVVLLASVALEASTSWLLPFVPTMVLDAGMERPLTLPTPGLG